MDSNDNKPLKACSFCAFFEASPTEDYCFLKRKKVLITDLCNNFKLKKKKEKKGKQCL